MALARSRRMSRSVPASAASYLAAFGGRGEGREQGGRDKPGGVVSLDAAVGGVFGGGVHEAEGGGGQPVLWQVGAEGSSALPALDEGLHTAQDRVVDTADPLGGQFPVGGQQDVAELVDQLPGGGHQPGERRGRVAAGVGGAENRVRGPEGPSHDCIDEWNASE